MNQNNTFNQFFLSLLRALRVLRGKIRSAAKKNYRLIKLKDLVYNKKCNISSIMFYCKMNENLINGDLNRGDKK